MWDISRNPAAESSQDEARGGGSVGGRLHFHCDSLLWYRFHYFRIVSFYRVHVLNAHTAFTWLLILHVEVKNFHSGVDCLWNQELQVAWPARIWRGTSTAQRTHGEFSAWEGLVCWWEKQVWWSQVSGRQLTCVAPDSLPDLPPEKVPDKQLTGLTPG